MISPTCGSWIGAVTWRMIRHGWRADRSSGGLLGAAARVGAAVEPPAGRALVDLPGADGHRPAQPVGVTAGLLHLVGVRRAVDAAVGHPPGRQPGAAAPPELRPALASGGRVSQHLAEVDVVVELLELPVAGGGDRLLERVGERARRAGSPSPLAPLSPSPAPSPCSPELARLARTAAASGGCSGSPTISRYSRAAASSRSRSPSGIQMTLA